ncbi:hypothetical protein PGB90_004491 [Kerria lacca]
MVSIFENRSQKHLRQNQYLLALEYFNSRFLMRSPWPILAITAVYVIFVTKIGSKLMKNRKPLNIKNLMLVYNLYQSLSNGYMFSKLFTVEGAINHLVTYACHPMDRTINPYCMEVANLAWLYIMSKLTDLLDTIFFVLRKKQSHITFLHVYHHTNMVLSSFFFAKYFHGEQLIIIGVVNTFVHTVMYGYYFLAALGPKVQKYLWWKIYVTRLQMLQFVFIIVYMAGLILANCDLCESLSLYVMFQGIIFFALFVNFYMKTYRITSDPKYSLSNGTISTKKEKSKLM